ncbi:hypothetical protein ACF8GB_00005 [Pseudomonas sp. xss_4]|uniref:hypothetical protein n=1 Tax=Pseudomonas TaxID=286 RepID=UPI0018AA89B5|nr:hypothetical protein [Pseudomonas putida]MBF8661876.1 hypothetical protein [Pseudomonas putida]
MKNNKEKKLSDKIADNALKILDSHAIALISMLSQFGVFEWGFAVLAVAFVLIVLIRIFYKFDPQRRLIVDSIIKRMVKALVLQL